MLSAVRSSKFWLNRVTVYIIYFIGINAMNIQALITGRMNVWKIFYYAWYHLIAHKDLYAFYPQEYFDSYLYSPSFPLLFAPFSLLPYTVGYLIWNNLSMLIIPFLVFKMPGISESKKALVCFIALPELLTCLQGTQTNVMIAALLMLTFLSFEKRRYWLAAFAIAVGFYIKTFPIVAASLFLLYPGRLESFLKIAAAFVIVGLLPLLFIKPSELWWQYQNWINELVTDQKDNVGKISLTGLGQIYFHISDGAKLGIQLAGVASFCLMYVRRRLFTAYYYRLLFSVPCSYGW